MNIYDAPIYLDVLTLGVCIVGAAVSIWASASAPRRSRKRFGHLLVGAGMMLFIWRLLYQLFQQGDIVVSTPGAVSMILIAVGVTYAGRE